MSFGKSHASRQHYQRQLQFEDSPSIGAVLRAPNLFVRESLAGMVTALALIPEVISFSFVSGSIPRWR